MTTELSGVDLARQALVAAREAVRKNGGRRKEKQRPRTQVVRRDGHEPLGLGSAIGTMMAVAALPPARDEHLGEDGRAPAHRGAGHRSPLLRFGRRHDAMYG